MRLRGIYMPLGCWVITAPVWLVVLIAALPFIAVYQVIRQSRLAMPELPPDYGLRSADGRWWWDGESWQPVR